MDDTLVSSPFRLPLRRRPSIIVITTITPHSWLVRTTSALDVQSARPCRVALGFGSSEIQYLKSCWIQPRGIMNPCPTNILVLASPRIANVAAITGRLTLVLNDLRQLEPHYRFVNLGSCFKTLELDSRRPSLWHTLPSLLRGTAGRRFSLQISGSLLSLPIYL